MNKLFDWAWQFGLGYLITWGAPKLRKCLKPQLQRLSAWLKPKSKQFCEFVGANFDTMMKILCFIKILLDIQCAF